MTLPRRLVVVAIGGVLGTWARWGLSTAYPVVPGTFPMTTFLVNMVGAFLLGIVLVLFLDRRPARPGVHSLLGTGVLGAFTTFSTFTVESVELVRVSEPAIAAEYVVATVVAGVVLVLLSMGITRRVFGVVERYPS